MSFKLNLLELTIIKVLGRGRVWLFSWYRYFYFRVQNSSYGTRVPIFSHPPCIVKLSETIFNVLNNSHFMIILLSRRYFWFLILLPRSTVPYLFLQASGNAFLLNFDLLFLYIVVNRHHWKDWWWTNVELNLCFSFSDNFVLPRNKLLCSPLF